MNPLSYIKYGSILALALVIFGAGWHFGSLGPTKKFAAYKFAQQTAQAAQESKQLKVNQKADEVHEDEIAAIRLRVVDTPVFVRIPTVIPVQSTPETVHPSASTGGTLPAARDVDIRQGINAFEERIESLVADCRRLDTEWPQ